MPTVADALAEAKVSEHNFPDKFLSKDAASLLQLSDEQFTKYGIDDLDSAALKAAAGNVKTGGGARQRSRQDFKFSLISFGGAVVFFGLIILLLFLVVYTDPAPANGPTPVTDSSSMCVPVKSSFFERLRKSLSLTFLMFTLYGTLRAFWFFPLQAVVAVFTAPVANIVAKKFKRNLDHIADSQEPEESKGLTG